MGSMHDFQEKAGCDYNSHVQESECWQGNSGDLAEKRHFCRSSIQVKTQKLKSFRSFTLPTEIFIFRLLVTVGKVRNLGSEIRVKFEKVLLETAISLPCSIADPIISVFPQI